MDAPAPPSPFLLERLEAVAAAARLGPVIDVACGAGRHALALSTRGIAAVGVDRDAPRLRELARRASLESLPLRLVRADLEAAPSLPWRASRAGALLVFRYLHRPLCAALAESLRPGGLILYETFTVAQRKLGYGPVNPTFLLEPGELPALFPTLEILAFEEGLSPGERPAALARLCARRPRAA
ncbi:MAG TPA: class I SAM-dependent methyltransferase [Myxococcota bacterium]|nr:class I SAM-dependent methyltransferase [Myxococcota bacterium]